MTSPKPEALSGRRSAVSRHARAILVLAAAASIALAGAGCQKKKKPPPPPPPPPKPQVVIPQPIDVNGVLQALKPDARVQFPETVAPADRSLAEGVIKLADTIAKGDAAGLKAMAGPNAQKVVDELVSSGGWAEGTQPIEQVRVVSVSNIQEAAPSESLVGLAIQGRDGAYLLAWEAKRQGDNWVFESSPCQNDVKARASDFDGVELSTSTEVSSAHQPDVLLTNVPTAPGAAPKPPPTPPPADPNGPIRKNTPAGPINIPRPPGGG